MSIQEYQAAMRDRMRQLPQGQAPMPWTLTVNAAVGGLTEVGFAEGSDLLLVVSSQGRGVFDCRAAVRVARNECEPDDSWYDGVGLTARGIGPIESHLIRLAGLHGGGLPRISRDGWALTLVAPDWPDELVVLEPRGPLS